MTKDKALDLALEALEGLIKKTSGQAIYSFMETERRIAMAACVGLREALAEQPAPVQEPVEKHYVDGGHIVYPAAQRQRVVFPTMLRKMWSGGEVQAWLDETVNKENT